ncbi:T9SS-dependent choice-of-anchor J family protein [Seonamhaeicola aphaedonensis]|uniref:Putative secreted protein (Por secretion system target) n=1 Tax=Seonamhaeicola aphaedonensis TaxID=1461338 RepID=A0A3D9HIT7_9FLAO|nr:choice-of-anchor J domain-containing protein [Seonamhaeicola aphaedonensis]RED49345.1 putative secreted protein (Por secretion system target) [Seonamhaeicola aphaedonensis]
MKKILLLCCVLTISFNINSQNSCASPGTISAGSHSVGTINGSAATLICDSNTAGTKAEWYAYTASTDGFASVTTDLGSNSGDDTNMYIYSGTCGSLSCLASSDDISPSNLLSEANFPISSGTTYYIVFDNRWSSSGFDFMVSETNVACNVTVPPAQENFSDQNKITACWDLIDADMDNRKWFVQDFDLDGTPGLDGNPCIVSRSWDAAGFVFPDNWIISYSIDITSYSSGDDIYLNWKARGINPSFANENYTVYVATGNDTSDFLSSGISFNEIIGQNGGAGTTFVDRSLDISSLAGNIVYVAFRHHNMPSSQYELHIDDVEISSSAPSLSNDDFEINEFSHFYNTSDKTLTLKSSISAIRYVEVYNILGAHVLTQDINSIKGQVHLSNQTDGIYIVKAALDDNIIQTLKIIKH